MGRAQNKCVDSGIPYILEDFCMHCYRSSEARTRKRIYGKRVDSKYIGLAKTRTYAYQGPLAFRASRIEVKWKNFLEKDFDDLDLREESQVRPSGETQELTNEKEASERAIMDQVEKELDPALTYRQYKSEIQSEAQAMEKAQKVRPEWKSDFVPSGSARVSFKVMFDEDVEKLRIQASKLKNEGRPFGSKIRPEKNPFNLETSPYKNKDLSISQRESNHKNIFEDSPESHQKRIQECCSQQVQTDFDSRFVELESQNRVLREELEVKERQLEEGQQLLIEFAKKEEEIRDLNFRIELLENEKRENFDRILPADLEEMQEPRNETEKVNENLVTEIAQLQTENTALLEELASLRDKVRELEAEKMQANEVIEGLKFQNELLSAVQPIEKKGSDKALQKEINEDSGFDLNKNSNSDYIQKKRSKGLAAEVKASPAAKNFNPISTEPTPARDKDLIRNVLSPASQSRALRLSNYMNVESKNGEETKSQKKKPAAPKQQTWLVVPRAEENFESDEELPQKLKEQFENDSRLSSNSVMGDKSDFLAPKEPLYSELIYPFTNPSEYYTKKPQKKYRGKIIKFDKFIFKDVDLQSDLTRFKVSCLREKASLAEAEGFQVGVISELYQHEKKNYLRITLYLGNKSDYNKIDNFVLQYVGSSDLTLFLKPNTLPMEIPSRTQLKQELVVDFARVPYPVIMAEFSYRTPGKLFEYRVPVPMTINKFLEPKATERADFLLLWRELKSKGAVYRSEPFELNRKIAKNAFEIKNYLKNLVELNPQKEYDYLTGGAELKLGGFFEMAQDLMNSSELLLKFVAKPNRQLVLMAASIVQNESLVSFVLSTLNFLFMS